MEIKSHTVDLQLLEEAKKGEQKAFTALMEKYRKSVYHLILKIVKSPEDAEDLMIETFAKAFDKIDQYSSDFAFSTWLYRIASNTCIDFLRRKSIDKVSLDNEADILQDNLRFTADSNPEADMIRAQRIRRLQEEVQAMDVIFSRVLTLRYLKEYSYEEISEELHIPVPTIKVQLHRARKRLLQRLSENREKW